MNFQGFQANFGVSLHKNAFQTLQFWEVHWPLRSQLTRAPLDFQGPRPPRINPGSPRPLEGDILKVEIDL